VSTDHERQLLARARELADPGDLAEEVLGILGGARRAGLDPDALGGLIGAALALGAGSLRIYAASQHTSACDERQFLGHLAATEDDIAERLHAARQLASQASAARQAACAGLDAAEDALAAARAMAVTEPCQGCHGARAAAISAAQDTIADAQARITACEDALQTLGELSRQLRYALARIRAVPADLGETYEAVYTLLRRGGVMPHHGRWITGS